MKPLLLLIAYSIPLLSMEERPLMLEGPKPPVEVQKLQEAPQGSGWNVKNETGRPITFAWYKSRTSPYLRYLGLYSYPWGYKDRIRDPQTLNTQETRFIILPTLGEQQGEWRGYRLWRQFIATYHPQLLAPSLQVTDAGNLEEQRLILFNEWDFPPALPFGTSDELIILGRTPGTEDITIVKEKPRGWHFINTTEFPLYARWYAAQWNPERRLYSELSPLENHPVFSIEPGHKAMVSYPLLKPRETVLQLVFAFNEITVHSPFSLDDHNKLPFPGMIARTQEEMSPFGITWNVAYEDGAPVLQPLSYIIRVNNTTNDILYAAMYYVNEARGTATKFGPRELVAEIKPQLSQAIQYPPKGPNDIQIALALEEHKELLKKSELTREEMRNLYFKSFAKTNFVNWWLQGDFDILYNVKGPNTIKISSVGGGALQRMAKSVKDISRFEGPMIEEFEARFQHRDPEYVPDADIVLSRGKESVITGIQNLEKEHRYTQLRSETVRRAINDILGDEIIGDEIIKEGQKVPRIALVFSGGGWRAMTETIGYLRGAASEQGGNIFDCATYMTGLSGSTWAINPLVVSGLHPEVFAREQRAKVGKGVGYVLPSLNTLIEDLIHKSSSYIERRFIESRYGQIHGPVGFYGHALAHALLGGLSKEKTAHQIKLSDMRYILEASPEKYPLPISVATDHGTEKRELLWFEFSPYYIGTPQEHGVADETVGGWIDSKLFGSTFKEGRPIHIVPEYPLAQYIGTWGSAFAINEADIAKESMAAAAVYRTIGGIGWGMSKTYELLVQTSPAEGNCPARITVAEYPNFSYQFSQAQANLKNRPSVCLIDAGISKEDFRHNFATIPALYRDVDMLILCDSHSDPNSANHAEHLFASGEEAKHRDLKFPNLTRGRLHKKAIDAIRDDVASIFVEKGKPVVVYIQAKQNKIYNEQLAKSENPNLRKPYDPDASVKGAFTGTTNFNYTPEQFDLLSGLTESIFIQSKDTIVKGIREVVRRQEMVR